MGPLIGVHRTVGSPGRRANAGADFDPLRPSVVQFFCCEILIRSRRRRVARSIAAP